ncbi:MAG: thiamine diphosphokinase [Anaerolineaceae bacterium]|nr:thiamine diphosphokinase [Anaerolineaceae bacterium]
MKRCLIFANGEPNDGPMVRDVLEKAADALTIAADGGARVAWYFGRHVDVVIGDMDSLTDAELQQLVSSGADVERYPPAKDETDLELALLHAAKSGAEWIRIIGGLGDRFDQTLANVYLMALPQLEGRDLALVAAKERLCLLRPGTHTLHGQIGDTLSLIPLGGAVTGITTGRLKYPLKDETLYFGPARGISNVFLDTTAQVQLNSGVLLVVHTRGRA